jgi:hypothetical protein
MQAFLLIYRRFFVVGLHLSFASTILFYVFVYPVFGLRRISSLNFIIDSLLLIFSMAGLVSMAPL